jgi:hypothetical protein
MSFKDYLTEEESSKYEWYSFEVEEYVVHIMFSNDEVSEINEARHKGKPLGGKYSAQLHSPHSSVGQQHIHVYSRNNQLFSLNIDGSAHDRSHGIKIPSKVAKSILQEFPSFNLPDDNVIESASRAVQVLCKMEILNEAQ